MQPDRFNEVPIEEDLKLGFQHGFGFVVEHWKSLSGKTQSSSDPSCVQVYKINEVYLRMITCAVYSLELFAIKYWLNLEQEINNPPNVEDVGKPIEGRASNSGNEWIHMLQFKKFHFKWWISIVVFHFSTAENTEAHTI